MGCCLCIGLAEVTVCCQMLWLCLRHVGEASDTVLVSEHCRSAVYCVSGLMSGADHDAVGHAVLNCTKDMLKENL